MVFTDAKRKARNNEYRGMSKLPEYKIWQGLKYRCNPNSQTKSKSMRKYYLGKIKISTEWKKSFMSFYSDIGPRKDKTMSIDRIDNDKGYCKHNCRWASKHEQAINRRITKTFGMPVGVSKKDSGRYQVRIRLLGLDIHLGTFQELEKATQIYEKFKKLKNLTEEL